MRKLTKKRAFFAFLAAAFSAVFIFGCVQNAMLYASEQAMEDGMMSASAAKAHQSEHADVKLPPVSFFEQIFPSIVVSSLAVILLAVLRNRAGDVANNIRRQYARQRYRHEYPFLNLFRVGILHPKIF